MPDLAEPMVLRFDNYLLDRSAGVLLRLDPDNGTSRVPLGGRAFRILCLLVERCGAIVTRHEIMDAVWPEVVVEENNLSVQLSNLRRVLDGDRALGSCIQTLPGRGYRFLPSVAPASSRLLEQAIEPSMADIVISGVGAAPQARRPEERPRLSLAVLPFNKFGDDVEDHIVDAVADDLITELSRYAGLRLTARSSAFAYKGRAVDIKRVGQELGVRYTVEGSLRGQQRGLAVNVQLASAESGEQLWAERFTVESDGPPDTADNVLRRIAFLVQLRVFESESARSLREHPDNPDATDALIRAYTLYNLPPNPEKNSRMVALYERAVELDPSSAPALAGLAEVLVASVPLVTTDDPTAPFKFRRAEDLVARADLLDPHEMRLLMARTFLLTKQGRCAEAIQAAQRVIEAHPVLSGPYQWLGMCLMREGHLEEAVQQFEQAIRTNPRTPQIDTRYRLMGAALLYLGRHEEAVAWFHRALAANPSLHGQIRGALYAAIAAAQALSGDLDAAQLSAAQAMRLWPPLTARGFVLFETTSQATIAQSARIHEALRAAGMRDHADEDADAGLTADDVLHQDYEALTPVGAPGTQTIRTPDVAALLEKGRPLVLDTVCRGESIPGTVGLWGSGIGGSLDDAYQHRLSRKMEQLTGGNRDASIVTMAWNAERYQGRNLALRLVALGYTEVYWYRGGREAWMSADLPTAEVTLQDW
jgi:TolB-like protein/DNA-binding winged helix-turn-helix (wHTH) protein/Tfp pilus assembly protein PilF